MALISNAIMYKLRVSSSICQVNNVKLNDTTDKAVVSVNAKQDELSTWSTLLNI